MLDLKKIILTTDLSERSLEVLPYAVGLAEAFGADLKIVYVHLPSLEVADLAWTTGDHLATDQDRLRSAQEFLRKIVGDKIPPAVRTEVVVLTKKSAVRAIVSYAQEQNADLIVTATHGRTGIAHTLLGSTAEKIVRKAPCPVLTLRQPMPVELPASVDAVT